MADITSSIEGVLSQLDEAGAVGPVMASVSWSFAMSLAQNQAAAIRLDNDDDPDTLRLNADQRNDRRDSLEQRRQQISSTLSWAVSYASPDYVPTGADVAQRIVDNDPGSYAGESDATIAETAEALAMSIDDVKQAAEADRLKQQENRRLQQSAIQSHIDDIAREVDRAVGNHCVQDFQLTDRDAERILERIAEKAETYEQNRVTQALKTRRRRRLAQFAAERQLLQGVMDAADQLIDRIQTEPEEKKEHEAASDHRVLY